MMFITELQLQVDTCLQSEPWSISLFETLWKLIWMCPVAQGLQWPWFSSGSRPWLCLKKYHSDSESHTDRCNDTHGFIVCLVCLSTKGPACKRVKKLTFKHTLPFLVWLTHSPHKMHLHGAEFTSGRVVQWSPEKQKNRSLLVLRLLNITVSTLLLPVDSGSPKEKSGWMLNLRSDFTGISIFRESRFYTSHNRYVYSYPSNPITRLRFHLCLFKPHYWGLRHKCYVWKWHGLILNLNAINLIIYQIQHFCIYIILYIHSLKHWTLTF